LPSTLLGIYVRLLKYQRHFTFTYGASKLTGRSALVLWVDNLAEVPINENTTCNVWFTLVDNHDIPSADITMKNTSLIGGFVG